jgi:hypothetical protein
VRTSVDFHGVKSREVFVPDFRKLNSGILGGCDRDWGYIIKVGTIINHQKYPIIVIFLFKLKWD